MKKWAWVLVGALICIGAGTLQQVFLRSAGEMRAANNLNLYPDNPQLRNVKVAVFGSAFGPLDQVANYLPQSADKIITWKGETPERKLIQSDDHDRMIAQIIWEMSRIHDEGPQIYLVNAKGDTNFHYAVNWAIREHIDIIVYAKNFEYAGNFRGDGYFNAMVNKALDAHILWINAAGNDHNAVYNDTVEVGGNGWLKFHHSPETYSLRLKSHFDMNPVKIVLAWDSVPQDQRAGNIDKGVDKDLDLFLYDEDGNEVARSTNRQILNNSNVNRPPPGNSFLPAEIIEKRVVESESPKELDPPRDPEEQPAGPSLGPALDPVPEANEKKRPNAQQLTLGKNRKDGFYRLRVSAYSKNFTADDHLRITVISRNQEPFTDPETMNDVNAVEFVDHTKGYEIMVPADNPRVLTVGDMSDRSSQGPTMDGREKPEIIMESSLVNFSNTNSGPFGSSYAAAYFAGIVTVMKARRPDLTRDLILEWMHRQQNQDAVDVTSLDLREAHTRLAGIFGAIAHNTGDLPVRADMYKDGRYLLGIRQAPAFIPNLFPIPKDPEHDIWVDYRYFIKTVEDKPEFDSYGRKVAGEVRLRGYRIRRHPQPGEPVETAPIEDVEIQMVHPGQAWTTPTPEQLDALKL